VLTYVFDVDLSDSDAVAKIRDKYVDSGLPIPRVFVLDAISRRSIVQAYAAGAHHFLDRPIFFADLQRVLSLAVNSSVERHWGRLSSVQCSALRLSLKVFEDMQAVATRGDAVNLEEVSKVGSAVINAFAHAEFPALLGTLREHHNYSFRHSMFVAATLVSFARVLKFSDEDTQKVACAALVHDVGKAATPIAILEKPGPLCDAEWSVMREHVVTGADILRRGSDWPADVVDAVLHHHERLDGSGYPNGLTAGRLSDLTRLVSIADTFSALIDKRSYKPPMSGDAAYRIMCGLRGKLDPALVEAFEPVALAIA
jgi:putative nucleotidyltransferase with HDIG domain